MELRQLEYFVEVCDRSSVSAAAKSLNMSQPALSRQIQQLERECGARLLDRVPAGVTTTSAGDALYQHAIAILRAASVAVDAVRTAGPVRETVEVGLSPGTPEAWIRAWIDAVSTEVPNAYLLFSDASSARQLQDVRAGRIDLGVVHEPPAAGLECVMVGQEPFGLAMAPDANIAGCSGQGPLSIAALDGVDVLVHAREQLAIGHDQLVAGAHHAGAAPRWHFASYVENARACAYATGSKAAVVSQLTARRLLPDWTWVRITEPRLMLQTWLVRQPKNRAVVRAVADVIIAHSLRSGLLDDIPENARTF